VWMGYEHAADGYLIQGSDVTAKFFKTVMDGALKGRKVVPFDKPSNVKEIKKPVQVSPITDLKGEQVVDSIQLTWSAKEEGAIYRVYRYFDDPDDGEFLGETDYTEWVDLDVPLDQTVHYS